MLYLSLPCAIPCMLVLCDIACAMPGTEKEEYPQRPPEGLISLSSVLGAMVAWIVL